MPWKNVEHCIWRRGNGRIKVKPDHGLWLQQWTWERRRVNLQWQRCMCLLWSTRTSTRTLWYSHAFISTLPNLCLDKTSIMYPCWCVPCVVEGIEDKLWKKESLGIFPTLPCYQQWSITLFTFAPNIKRKVENVQVPAPTLPSFSFVTNINSGILEG